MKRDILKADMGYEWIRGRETASLSSVPYS